MQIFSHACAPSLRADEQALKPALPHKRKATSITVDEGYVHVVLKLLA